MPKSNYLDNVVLNLMRGVAYVPPTQVYVALFTVSPAASGGGVEVSAGSYARQLVTFNAPASQILTSATDVAFPIATVSYGTIVAFALFDQGVSGNMLYFAALSAPRLININDQVRFPAGQLVLVEA